MTPRPRRQQGYKDSSRGRSQKVLPSCNSNHSGARQQATIERLTKENKNLKKKVNDLEATVELTRKEKKTSETFFGGMIDTIQANLKKSEKVGSINEDLRKKLDTLLETVNDFVLDDS